MPTPQKKTNTKPLGGPGNGGDPRSKKNTTAPSNASQKPLTAAEQAQIKAMWEKKYGKKATAGQTFGVSSVTNFRNRTGGYSITTTNERRSTGSGTGSGSGSSKKGKAN